GFVVECVGDADARLKVVPLDVREVRIHVAEKGLYRRIACFREAALSRTGETGSRNHQAVIATTRIRNDGALQVTGADHRPGSLQVLSAEESVGEGALAVLVVGASRAGPYVDFVVVALAGLLIPHSELQRVAAFHPSEFVGDVVDRSRGMRGVRSAAQLRKAA